MAKKRTKQEKQNAKHTFTLSWEPNVFEANLKPSVKSQFKNEPNTDTPKSDSHKNPIDSAQIDQIIKTRKNIIKSLILAGIILGSEIVLYFFWK